MGVSVIGFSERFDGDHWVLVARDVMDFHSMTHSGFLTGFRNASMVPPIAEPRGIPEDLSVEVATEFIEDGPDAVEPSWLSVQELLSFDYDQQFEDRRVAQGASCKPGEGKVVTYREFLTRSYFEELERLSQSGAQRVVFWYSI